MNISKKLSSLDSVFIHLESNDTPMHVAGLQTFRLPDNAGDDFVQTLVEQLRQPTRLRAPWNLKLKQSALGNRWLIDQDVDLDYHIRHLALPRPGGERELGVMISRLHGHRLRRHRPLWECYVIEGLADNRFAIYTKIHHALADGMTGMRLLTEWLSESPDETSAAPWVARNKNDNTSAEQRKTSLAEKRLRNLKARSSSLPAVSQAAGRMLRQAVAGKSELTLPYTAPRSVLNGKVGGQRRYATQQIDIARIKAVGKATDTTLNDVVLALCGAALRRFLKEANQLPNRSLVASVPVSVRPPGDTTSSNAVCLMFAGLGTDIADPVDRLDFIRASTQDGKAHLQAIPGAAQTLYNSLLLTPFVLQNIAGLGSRGRPCFNVTVSNVPGPSRPLYLHGAQLEALYPVSIPTHGQAVNITCTSYNGSLNFGFCGCRDALPHLQRMAVYLGEAMTELEDALGLRPVAVKPRRQKLAASA